MSQTFAIWFWMVFKEEEKTRLNKTKTMKSVVEKTKKGFQNGWSFCEIFFFDFESGHKHILNIQRECRDAIDVANNTLNPYTLDKQILSKVFVNMDSSSVAMNKSSYSIQ